MKGGGGARAGAGAKPHPSTPIEVGEDECMLEVLKKIALGKVPASPTQLAAAVAYVRYSQPAKKPGPLGRKEQRQADAAEVVGENGRFPPGRPPGLKVVGKK